MKYFVCPSGDQCGPTKIYAQKFSQTYSMDTIALKDSENICNHQITIGIDGGINDILKVKFLETNPGTIVKFSVGKSFASSRGEIVTDLTDKLLKIGFPNSLFLSIEHVTQPTGRVSIEFWYKDQGVENEEIEKVTDGYSLITEVTGK